MNRKTAKFLRELIAIVIGIASLGLALQAGFLLFGAVCAILPFHFAQVLTNNLFSEMNLSFALILSIGGFCAIASFRGFKFFNWFIENYRLSPETNPNQESTEIIESSPYEIGSYGWK